MKVNIKLVVQDTATKLDVKKLLLDALFSVTLDSTTDYKKIDHETNDQVTIKIKRDNE